MAHRNLRPTPNDGNSSPTSVLQASTESILRTRIPLTPDALPSDSKPVEPVLQRNLHLQFLLRNLVQGFPARYISQDASQPWLMFWTLQGFSALGVGLDEKTKQRAIETLLALQHPSGGFCGGPGQSPHLLPTYAAVSSFAMVGHPGEGGGWDQIDRKKMYDFFMSLKQPDGSFLVARHAEVDVRGIYCLLTVATLLNILTPELLAGTPGFIASCQTYEGGFGNASFPGWALSDDTPTPTIDPTAPRPPLGEAHGGYTFCATASWILLQPYIRTFFTPSPNKMSPMINLPNLLRWLTHMQGNAVELGGFKGRTNKLVDGCYSWWVGGCVVLVEGLLGVGSSSSRHIPSETKAEEGKKEGTSEDDDWDDVDDSLFNRRALQEYVLYAGQHHAGGLVDKPPKPADAYHTLYCLSGLSAAQHRVTPSVERKQALLRCWKEDEVAQQDKVEKMRQDAFASALSWIEEEGTSKYVGGVKNRLNATHPLFDLTITHAEGMMAHFYGRVVPTRYKKKEAAKA